MQKNNAQKMSSRRERRQLTGRTNSNPSNQYDRMNNGVARINVVKPETPLSQRRFDEPLSQRKGLGELDKREWCESARRAETPPEIPRRIGSIASGGVDGFGFVRADTKVNPIKIANMAGKPAIFLPNHQVLSPGGPWWERERFKSRPLKSGRNAQTSSRPTSPLPFGSAMHIEALRNDGKLTETEMFLRSRPDLLGEDPKQIQRELLSKMIAKQESSEIPREVALGPDFFNKTREQCLNLLMHKLDTEYQGKFSLLHQHMLQDEYSTKVRSSALMHKTLHPKDMYGPPPHHPDAVDGYLTTRRKHEKAMSRLYGHADGKVHLLPDNPHTWNRRDGVKAGIPGIQSFTYYAHQLQNAGYGAP